MATGTVYLDVDDEITSAAARIRSSEATKVALVIPYGSRIATSRMNFRLLSREAVVNNRRLSIVASDAATRALAASAGLPVFASVAEYDAAAGGSQPADADQATAATGAGLASNGHGAAVAGAAALGAAALADAGPGDSDVEAKPASKRTRKSATPPPPPVSDETQKIVVPPPPVQQDRPLTSAPAHATAGIGAAAAASTITPAPTVRVPVVHSRRMPRIGASAVVIVAVAILAVVVVAVAGYVFLPSAEITLTPREEAIPPISLTVRADPDAVVTDADAGIVPAERLEVPVEVSKTFETTGRRVVEEAATGTVTFRNVDFTEANTIAGGSIVSTQGGVRFRTNSSVTVGKARLVGLQIIPTEANVGVTAVSAGTAGNVEPNTITVVPAAEDPQTLSVRNGAATSGGTHEEFPQVTQAEVDAALVVLNEDLSAAFTAAVEDGAGAPENTTVYPETAVLGEATPSPDPATLVGQEVASFDLSLSANGTVIAVDDSPVEGIAEQRLLANVGSDYRLVDGSIEITPGSPTVSGGEVTFPVTASAARVRLLDEEELLALVKGKTVDEAEAALDQFGEVDITPWPDWVSSIPSMDSRVTLVIVGQDEAAGPGASVLPGSSGSPRPDGSP